jgi:hypothetical protein
MANKRVYKIEGRRVESEQPLTEAEIDEIAHNIRKASVSGKARQFSEGLEQGMEDTYLGVRQFAASLAADLGLDDERDALALTDQINKNRLKYNLNPASESLYGKTGQVVGESLPYMAVPVGGTGGVVKNILEAGSKAGLIEAMKPTSSSDFINPERAANLMVGTAVGAGAQSLFEVGGLGINMVRTAFRTPKGEVQKMVGKEDINQKVSEIAEEFGIRVTPFEVSQRPELMGVEADLNPEAADLRNISEAFLGDAVTLARKNDEFIESIFEDSAETQAIITRGYNSLKNMKDKGNIVESITADPYMRRQYERFLKDGEVMDRLQSEGISEDSLAFINEFRQYIRDKAGTGSYVKVENGVQTSTKAGRKLTEASNTIRDALSELSPEFAQANRLVRYKKVKEGLQNTLDDAPATVFNIKGNEIEFVDPAVLFKKHFGSNKAYEELRKTLQDQPEALAKLEKIREINRALVQSPLRTKILKAQELGIEPEGGGVFGAQTAAGLSLLGAVSRKNQAAMLDYITNDNWQADIFDSIEPSLLKQGSFAALQQLQKAITLISAAGATKPAQSEQ